MLQQQVRNNLQASQVKVRNSEGVINEFTVLEGENTSG
jgi:hypothetical protein